MPWRTVCMLACLGSALSLFAATPTTAIVASDRSTALPSPLPVPTGDTKYSGLRPGGPPRSQLHTITAIEDLVIQSKLVLRGTILNFQPVDEKGYAVFNLRVDETFKPVDRPAASPFVWFIAADADGRYPSFMVPGRHILLISTQNDRGPLAQYYPLFDLDSRLDPPFWTMFGKALRTADDLIPAIRDAVRDAPPNARRSYVSIAPFTAEMKQVQTWRSPVFYIPVDRRTQVLAERMLNSGDERQQSSALYLLSKLPSPENAARLRQFLTDTRLGPPESPLSPWAQRPYRYRRDVADLLSSMGYPVKGVKMGEPAELYHLVPIWPAAVAVPTLIGAWMLVGRMRWLALRSIRIAYFAVIYLILIGLVALRSIVTLDDFCLTRGDRLYNLSLHNSRFRYEIVYRFRQTTPLVHASFSPFPPSQAWKTVWHGFKMPGSFPAFLGAASPVKDQNVGPGDFFIASAPFWPLYLPGCIGLLAPLTLLAGPARRRRMIARGLCGNCGYDLKAHHTGDKCPECGCVVN